MNKFTSSNLITVKRCVSLAAAFVCLSAFPTAAQSYQRVIRVSGSHVASLGAWRIAQSASYAASKRALGKPSREVYGTSSCGKAWWHRLGLTIGYEDFGTQCATHGYVQDIAIRGRIGRNSWKTDRRLRIGDTVSQLRRSYPHARKTGSSYQLYPYWSSIGSGFDSPVVARTSHGRVDTFILWIGGAGE